jgi:hypothetical protein
MTMNFLQIRAKSRSISLIVSIFTALIACITTADAGAWTNPKVAKDQEVVMEPVSIIRVIANPQEFNGKRVMITGYLITSFEKSAVFLNSESYDRGLFANAIWLQFPPEMTNAERNHFSKQYVSIQGTFHADLKGHINAFSGTLGNLEKVDVIPSEASFRRKLAYQYLITTWPRAALFSFTILLIVGIVVWRVRKRRLAKSSNAKLED